MSRRRWAFVAAWLCLVGAGVLVLLNAGLVVPSWLRDPLHDFVQPGVAVWWLVLGGPFRVLPVSVAGIAFAAVANAALWSLAVWLALAALRGLRRGIAALRS